MLTFGIIFAGLIIYKVNTTLNYLLIIIIKKLKMQKEKTQKLYQYDPNRIVFANWFKSLSKAEQLIFRQEFCLKMELSSAVFKNILNGYSLLRRAYIENMPNIIKKFSDTDLFKLPLKF